MDQDIKRKMSDGNTDIDIDDVLTVIGGFGPFQWLCIFAFCMMIIPTTFPVLAMYFLAQEPKWQCTSNSSVCLLNGTHESYNTYHCSIPRTEWEFTEPLEFSIVTQFDIYCHKRWLLDLATGVFFLGAACGGIGFGILADKKGRKFVLFTSLTLLMAIGLASAYSPNIYVFIASRLAAGSCFAGSLAMTIIMVAELVESNRRALATNIIWLFYSLAFCLLALKAYYIKKWKLLLIVCTAPYFVVLVFFKIIPESIHWLSLKRKQVEIEAILERMAKQNNRLYSPVNVITKLEKPHKADHSPSSYTELFKPYNVAFRTIIQAYNWFACSMIYYGLSLASDELGGSMYLNFALISIMECPGHLTCAYISNRYGRKPTAIAPMFLASISCIIIPFIPITGVVTVARVVCGMLGKYFITISYDCLYLWSAEIFPTSNRAKGIGLMQLFEMMGGACAPFITKELQVLNVIAPFLVFGLSSIVGTCLMKFLPETNGKSLDS